MKKKYFISFLFMFFINNVCIDKKKLQYNKEKSWLLRKKYASQVINYFIPKN